MSNLFKRFLSIALVLMMVVSMLPTSAFATNVYDVSNMSDEEIMELCIQLAEEGDLDALEAIAAELGEERMTKIEEMYAAMEGNEPAVIAENTATVTAYKQVSYETDKVVDLKYFEYVGTATDLEDAASKLGNANGGLIEISEGTLVVTNRQDISMANVIIKGAGKDKTTITGNANNFNNSTNGLANKNGLSSEYKAILSLHGANIKVVGLTVDAGSCGHDFGLFKGGRADLKTVRVNSGVAYLEDIAIKGSKTKTNLMIGSSNTKSTVYATNITVAKAYTVYGDTEIASGSNLTAVNSVLGGTVVGSVENLGAGYYKISYNGLVAYTTIPYAIECYKSATFADMLASVCTNEGIAEGTTVAQAMTNDLVSGKLLYGNNCEQMRVLAVQFRAALAGLSADTNVNVDDCLTALDAALANKSWHKDIDNNGTCDACSLTVPAVEIPSIEQILPDNASDEVKEVVQAVITEVAGNAAVQDFAVELPAEVKEMEIVLTQVETKAESEATVAAKLVFNVAPKNENGAKIAETSAEITFRLPIPAAWSTGYVKVTHKGESTIHKTEGTDNAKYVEISSADFSEFAVAPITHYKVATYEELIAALANDGAYVIMTADITATATQSSGYGKAGIVIDAGDVLDGKGYTLTINGAGATWDCAIAMRGGEVKNLTIAGAMRGVFMPGANGNVVIDNCVFKDVIYTFNSDAGSKDYTVTIKNTTLNGWTSFSAVHKSVTFESCAFGEGSGYAFCRPYQATTFVDCDFENGYEIDTKQTDSNTLVFNECTYNGEKLSIENSAMFYNGGSVVIDDEATDLDVVAKIGDTYYATLAEAIAAAKAMTGDVTVEILDKVTLNAPLTGNFDSIKFVGKTETAEIYMDVQGYIEASGKKVAFENLKLSKVAGGYITNAGFMNLAFGIYGASEVTYTNCTFLNGAYASSGKNTFTGCTFYRSHDRYGLWAYGAQDIVVDGCTFADIRGIKMYDEGKAGTTSITVKNTDFTVVDNKPAIVLTYGASVVLENNTYSEKGVFELDLDGNPNGVAVTSDVPPTCVNDNGACGVLVDGKIYTTVAQAAEIAAAGSNVTLLHDSTETVEFAKGVILDKNGYTAAGVTVKSPYVAQIGENKYETLEDALAAVQSGDTIKLLDDVTISADITLPAGITLDGNGKSITGATVCASGNLTFKGHTKVTNFNAGYNKPVITIGVGATLELIGSSRMVIGHGATFNITGNITDAKTANVADLTPSLIMPGASFTGAGVTFNVTNAYIKAPSSYCSSSKSASGTFDFNITNSIIETAGKLAFEAQSTAATVNFELKDSVLTTGSHLVFGVSKGEIVIDNSNVNVGKSNQIENQSTMTIKNGSVVNGAVATSSNAKNPGTVIVENATYAVTGEFSGSDLGTGTLILKKGATVSAGSITKANIIIDATDMQAGDEIKLTANLSKLAGTLSVINNDKLEAKIVDGKIVLVAKPVAQIGDTYYTSLEDAFKAATEGCTIEILADVTIGDYWDARNTGAKFTVPVTIDGNGHTIKFTNTVYDGGNYMAAFRFEADATVKNLTIDMSEAISGFAGRFRAISAKGNLTVDGCTFIGNGSANNTRAVIFGEGATSIAKVTITDSKFEGWRRGISDNESGKDIAKEIVITGNTLKDAGVAVSATTSVTFTGNTVTGAYVDIRSYTEDNSLNVTATGNTLTANTADKYNNIKAGGTINAQSEFVVPAKGDASTGYVSSTTIWGECGGNAKESFVIKIYSGETYLGYTKLNNIDGILDGSVWVTWHAMLIPENETDPYWTTEWEVELTSDKAPTKIELWIDGVCVDTGAVYMNGPDGLWPVVWEELDGVKYVCTGLKGSGTEADPFMINRVEDLIFFRDSVNAGNTYSGKFVRLNADIDLDQDDWTPISKFNGTFDGDNHKISNLWITGSGNLGFFNQLADQTEHVSGTVKNVIFENVTIVSTNGQAGLIADARLGARVSNVKLIGEVTISGYRGVGGIVGAGFPVIDNCTVEAEGTITATYWGVGGILGFASDAGAKVSNATVKGVGEGLTIYGAFGGVGGVTGTPYGAATNGATISNVTLSSSSNYYLGYVDASGTVSGTISVTDTVVEVNGQQIVGNDAVATADGAPYFSIVDAFAAGGEIVLYKNVTITNTLKVNAGQTVVLDLNGKTIDGTEKVRIAIMSYGDLTIKDSAEDGVIKAGIGTAGNAINICAGTFTLESGSIYSKNNAILVDEQAAVINIEGGKITAETATKNSAVMYVSSTSDTVINITGGELVGYNGILLWNNTTVNMNGGTITATGSTGIQGNGTCDNTKITITDGEISGYWSAIYHPQGGELNISGGTLTGYTGVVVKGGKVTISGGTINGTGAADTYRPVSSGYVDTGDALYVEHYDNSTNSENYGTPVVTVIGGTFNSAYGNAVASYVNTNNNIEALSGFISGGIFSSDVSELCAEGFVAKANGDGTFGVVLTKLYIRTLADLKAFRDAVNNGNTYAGVTVYLAADIDLAGENWVAIGSAYADHGFMGNFDGNGFKIKNLTINNPAVDSDGYAYAGFFGVTEGAAGNENYITNLVIENVTINTTGHIVAAAIAYPYYTTVSNITVCGNIAIEGGDYTAGVLAYTRRCVNASNLTISGNAGSYITGNQVVGGVISDLQMNGGLTANYSNFSASGLKITGSKMVGGISGIIATQTLNGATVKDVTLVCSDARVGIVAGALGGTSTISNVTATNVTGATNKVGAAYDSGLLVVNNGDVYTIVTPVAKIGNIYYATLADAIAAANGGSVEILCDVAEDLASIENVTFVTNVAGGVTITNTCTDWIDLVNVTVDSGVTLKIDNAYFTDAGVNYIEGTLEAGTLYNAYNSKTIVRNGGKIITTGMIVNRYHTAADAGIYVYGDGDNSTVEVSCANTIGTYSGTFYVEDAVVEANMLWIDYLKGSTQEADKYSQSKPVFVNSVLTVASELRLYKDATLTLTDSTVTAGKVQIREAATPTVTMTNSTITAPAVENLKGATLKAVKDANNNVTFAKAVAMVNGETYTTLADAYTAANVGATIELLADVTLTDVFMIGKSITINGNGYTITSSANRVIRVTASNIEVTINDLNMVSTAAVIYPSDVRGISIDASLSNVKLTLNNCSVDFKDVSANDWTYAVNVSGNGTGHTLTVNGGIYEGANVINVHGANNTVIVKNATLNSMYPDSELYYGAGIWVLQNQGSTVTATGNTFNGRNAIAFNLGTGTVLNESDNIDNTTLIVAKIGNVYYTSLAEAFAAAQDGETITLVADVALSEGITNTKKVTLDLNGKTITGTDNATGSFGLITNKSELTITGNGKITLTATNNRGWNAYSSVISNTVGGKLVVDNGTIEHLGGTDMAYAIDNLTNGKATYAETVINGGTIKSTYRAIRQFLNGVEAQNILTVNGGTIEGANKSIWMQDPSKNANTGKLTVGENAVLNGDVYLYVCEGSTEWPVEVSIAASAVNGEILSANVPATFVVENVNGTWGVIRGLKGSGTAEDPYQIGSLTDLIFFRDSVNAGEGKYNDAYVQLTADIDMSSVENWEPIGNVGYNSKYAPADTTKVFSGVFDGNDKVISNLKMTKIMNSGADAEANLGLFGITGDGAVIENLTITNVTINTDGRNVGALAGFAYGATLDNITVNGDIQIKGGNNVAGVCAMTRHHAMSATKITVNGKPGSTIEGKNIVGGIFAEIAPNGTAQTFENLSVENVAITGVSGVGGIVGLLTEGAMSNVSVKNVALTGKTEYQGDSMGRIRMGSVVGLLGGTYGTVANAAVENVTGKNLGGEAVALPVVGANYSGSIGNATEAKIGDKYYATFAKAYAAAQTGETIVLLAPIVVNAGETLTLDKNVTITYTSDVAGEDMITVRGTLNVAAGKITYVNTDTTGSNVTVSTISCEPGSVVNVIGGTVENKTVKADGSSIYSYAIDLLTNGNMGDVTVTISGGTVYSDYMAIRQFNNGTACKNTLSISGGYIYGAKRAVQIHLNNNAAYTAISGGKIEGGDYALCFLSSSENIEVSGGQFIGSVYSGANGIITGGTYDKEVYSGYLANGYVCVENEDGTYGVELKPVVELFDLYGANMDLGNKLDMNFYVLKKYITDENSYVVITKSYANAEDVTITIPYSEWVDQSKDLFKFSFTNIAAKEMADTITVTIYDSLGNQISNVWTDGVRAYCMRMLDKELSKSSLNVTKIALYVDMLNYGAAAQAKFDYNTGNLANATLTDAMQAYATQIESLENNSSFDSTYYYGANMDLESSIKFNMYFKRSVVTSDMTATITYQDHLGETRNIMVEGSQFVEQSADLYKIVLDELVVADVKQVVTCVITDAEGNEVTTVVESIESYLSRVSNKNELYMAIMKFGISAKNYLHS